MMALMINIERFIKMNLESSKIFKEYIIHFISVKILLITIFR